MNSAVTDLRRETPALGLTLGFSPPSQRPIIADAILLWLEVRRAMRAGEPLIAAARMAWWRDALTENRSEGVPLAERLIAHGGTESLIAGIDARINTALHGADPAAWHEHLAAWLSQKTGAWPEAAQMMLDQLEASFSGTAAARPVSTGQASLDLMAWCCTKPSRLDYPEKHPLLALQMMLVAIRLPRKPASG